MNALSRNIENAEASWVRVPVGESMLMAKHRSQLVGTKPHYGGVRWWFLCSRCDRRVSRLHLPIQVRDYFLCRVCHNLTYESVQASRTKSE